MTDTVEQRDVQAREVFGGGYVLVGTRRFNSVASGVNVSAQTVETIAADRDAAQIAVQNFLNTGSFS